MEALSVAIAATASCFNSFLLLRWLRWLFAFQSHAKRFACAKQFKAVLSDSCAKRFEVVLSNWRLC